MAKKTVPPDAAIVSLPGKDAAAPPPQDSNVPFAATLPGMGKTTAQWLEQCRGIGFAYAAANKRVAAEVTELKASATNFQAAVRRTPEVQVAGERHGVDDAYWAAVHTLIADAVTASHQVPTDLRKIEVVTPADAAVVKKAQRQLSRLRRVMNRYGASTGTLEQLELLGRGDAIGESPSSVYDVLNTFVSQAPERAALILDAGISPSMLAAASRSRDELEALAVRTGERRAKKEAIPAAVTSTKRALESALGIGAARIEAALDPEADENKPVAALQDPSLLEQILATLPRRADRRKARAPAGGTRPPTVDGKTDPESAPQSKTEPDNASTSGAEPAEKPAETASAV